MLYLAEVKKQTKGLIGGLKTELKLLACQRNDQSWNSSPNWSPIPGEEILSCEYLDSLGEGALLMVNLSENRQVQGKPELAGTRLVRLLQNFSRILEKSKSQEEEIEQWKESLTYQSQELARRELEIETRLQQLEEKEKALESLYRQRQDIDRDRENLRSDQLHHRQQQSIFLQGEQAARIEGLIARLSAGGVGTGSLQEQLNIAVAAVNCQQEILQGYWRQLEQQKADAAVKQGEVARQGEELRSCKQEWQSTLGSLEGAKIELQQQRAILASKQELARRLHLNLQVTEELQETIARLANGAADVHGENRVDVKALENMPLGELQAIVDHLQKDLEKLVRFVNDQEEELTLQSQTVRELEEKLRAASEYEHLEFEGELAEEQERRKMLDETLLGQRRTLRERQEILIQHLRILKRRQGKVEIDTDNQNIDLKPILSQLGEQQNNVRQERQKLESEIQHIQQTLQQIQEMIDRQAAAQNAKEKALQEQEEKWQQAKVTVAQLQLQVQFYEETLGPLQTGLNEIRQQLEAIDQLLHQIHGSEDEQHQAIAEVGQMLNSMMRNLAGVAS